MDAPLHAQLDAVIEALRDEVHQQAECWSTIRTPSELFDFEQNLQAVLNSLQAGIVGAVLEAIHRDREFVTACQHQVQCQCGVHRDGWGDVWVHTLGGHPVPLKTPYATRSTASGQERLRQQRRQHGTGIYPVVRRLGIIGRTTPRLLAEVNRCIADGPSGAEAVERFASRESRLTQQPMRGLVRDFASIALWQRQVEAAYLEQVTVYDPAPFAGKRVVVGLDGGRLRLRINKIGSEQTPTRKYATDQCEPKLFAIYTVDDQGNKERKGDVFYDGTLQSAEALFTLLKLRLTQLAIQHARLLVIIGEGASWIWNGVPALRRDLALPHFPVVESVDWGHAAGKLMPPAKVGLPEPQQQPWYKRMRTLLKQGHVNAILDALQALDQRHDTDEVIRTAINKYPPAKPEVLRLLAPQRGLTAIAKSKPKTKKIRTADSRNCQTLGVPRQSRGFTMIKLLSDPRSPYAIRDISSSRSPDREWEYREGRQADCQPPAEGCESLLASSKRRRNRVSPLPDQERSVGDVCESRAHPMGI